MKASHRRCIIKRVLFLICTTNSPLTRSMLSHNSFNYFLILLTWLHDLPPSCEARPQWLFWHHDVVPSWNHLRVSGKELLAPLCSFKVILMATNVKLFLLGFFLSCMFVNRNLLSIFGALNMGTIQVLPCFMNRIRQGMDWSQHGTIGRTLVQELYQRVVNER